MTNLPRAAQVEVDATGLTVVTGTDVQTAIEELDAAAGAGGYTDEQVRDVIGAALVEGSGIDITVNDGADTITIATTGSGSGVGPDSKPTLHTLPSSANAKDDEFNDTTGMSGPVNGLDAQWSKHNLGTSSWLVLDDTKAPGALLFDIPAGQAQDQSIYQAAPAGAFTVTARFQLQALGDRQMWALFIVDSGGTGISISTDHPTGDVSRLRSMSSWAQSGSLATATVPDISTITSQGIPVTVKIRDGGSGTYYVSAAAGDRVMPAAMYEVSGVPTGFTPAYIGFGRIYSVGGSFSKVALDYFRVT